ncbi:hypothetical protein OOK60_13990 [Trichothermofontia sichuanensis B231]|uniref:hypothetical protein n=1 Tax=Trichothermofontia sichuanensis TaxID=3045816 RepID=UPI0022454B5C|nr:hypothetical protein [Trichothermofontia sichuanensis]UZQ53599.1 hypothetical protein OOK60_13990 [Trichothermofontia sichuanensis B231]
MLLSWFALVGAMPYPYPSHCRLSRAGMAIRLVACLLLGLVASHPTLAAEGLGGTSAAAAPGLGGGDRAAATATRGYPLPLLAHQPVGQSVAPPSLHLSGASLLFVIWLVAEQVSVDLYEQPRSLVPCTSSSAFGQAGCSPSVGRP